jgi:hypothetical protein
MIIRSFLLAVGVSLATAFTVSCGYALSKSNPLPKNLHKTYKETVDVPGVSAEDLFKKIRLYLIGKNFLRHHFGDTYKRTGGTSGAYTYANTASWASKVDGVFDEENNRIIFMPEEELSNPLTGTRKKKVTKIEVLMSSGQYRVIGTLDSIHSSGINIEKDFKEFLPEIEAYWLSFITEMKQAITEQVTNEEFEKLIESKDKTNEMILKAAIARPNNAVALLNLGNSIGNKQADYMPTKLGDFPGKGQQINNMKPMNYDLLSYRFAAGSFNMAVYVLWLIPEKDSKVNEALQHWQNSSARAISACGSSVCPH